MMDPNDYIDDIAREGMSNDVGFDYKPEYWQEMESLLVAQQNRRKKQVVLFWFSSVSSVAAIILLFFNITSFEQVYSPRNGKIAFTNTVSVDVLNSQYASLYSSAQNYTSNNYNANAPIKSVKNLSTLIKSQNSNFNSTESINANSAEDLILKTEHNSDNLTYMNVKSPSEISSNKLNQLTLHEFDLSDLKSPDNQKRHHMNIYGGANVGMFVPSGYSGVDYFAGLSYSYDISKRFTIESGVQYTRKSMNMAKEETANIYSFGKRTEKLSTDYKNLHYLQMPTTLKYNIKNHVVLAQVTPSYAIGVQTNYTYSVYSRETKSFEAIKENKNNYGAKNGVNQWDVQVGLGYEYKITPFMNIGAMVSMGTIDVTDNTYWNSSAKDLNVDGKVYLKFQIL